MEEIIVLGFLLFVLVSVIVIFFGSIKQIFLKSKNDFWTGEVIDKKYGKMMNKKYRNKIDYVYFLLVRTDEKIQRKIKMSRDMWIKFKVGDVLEKQMGKLFPKKIS